MEHLDEKSQGFAGFFSYCLEKNRQKNSMPGGRSYLGSLFVGAVQPGWESDSSSVKPEGGDGSTISDGKSFCVSIRRGTPGCACHSVCMVQCFLVSYCPPSTASQLNGCSHTGIPHLSSQESRISNYPLCFIQKKGDYQPEIFPETVFLESDLRYFISLSILHPAPSSRMVSSSIFT